MLVGEADDVLERFPVDCFEEKGHDKRVDQSCSTAIEESVPPPFECRNEGVH